MRIQAQGEYAGKKISLGKFAHICEFVEGDEVIKLLLYGNNKLELI